MLTKASFIVLSVERSTLVNHIKIRGMWWEPTRPKPFQGWALQRPESVGERWSQCPRNNVETHFVGNVGEKYFEETALRLCRSVTASRELLSVQRDISLLEMWHEITHNPALPSHQLGSLAPPHSCRIIQVGALKRGRVRFVCWPPSARERQRGRRKWEERRRDERRGGMPLRPKFGRVTLSGKELGVRRRVESESARFSYRYWLICSRYGAIRLRGGGKVSEHLISCFVNFGNNFRLTLPVTTAPLWQLMA